jgi:ribonuclease BN (tRNA processing enzyme)
MGRSAFGTIDKPVKITFWGVRGSIPMSGTQVARYGGSSACVEVSAPGTPAIIFDCGTGAKHLGRELLLSGQTEITILLSHTHMDHIFGLPFFAPIQSPRCSISIAVPATGRVDARNQIGRYLNGALHPVRISNLGATVDFRAVQPNISFELGPYEVRTMRLAHPGGSIGYRVNLGERSVCYLTDTGPLASPGEGLMMDEPPTLREQELIEFVSGTDLLIMDATFTQDEFLEKMTWGHCYPEYAARVGKAAQVKQLALFHHSPDASDEDLDQIKARWQDHAQPSVFLAKEGMVVDLSG